MSDTTPYPRKTISAVTAALAGTFGVLATLLITTLTAGTGNFTTVNTSALNATGTSALMTAVVTSESVYSSTIGALNVSSTLITPSLNATSSVATTLTATNGTITNLNVPTSIISPSITGTSTAATTFTLASGKGLILNTSATSSIDFPAVLDGMCSSTTMTVTGATAGATSPNSVDIGYDPVFRSGYATTTNVYGYVSAADTVTINVCAQSAQTPPVPMQDPPALVFRATVKNFNP